MSESVTVEIWEYQSYANLNGVFNPRTWIEDPENPWMLASSNTPSMSIDEIDLPGGDWSWVSNWRIVVRPQETDVEGWEYASSFKSFQKGNRFAKAAKTSGDRLRRRMWSRSRRREVVSNPNLTVSKVGTEINAINIDRVKLEETIAQFGGSSDMALSAAHQVKSRIASNRSALDQIEKQLQQAQFQNINSGNGSSSSSKGGSTASESASVSASIKKLRNDLMKAEGAVDKALGMSDKDSSTPRGSFSSRSSLIKQSSMKNPVTNTPIPGGILSINANSNSNSNSNVSGNNSAASTPRSVVGGSKGSVFMPSVLAQTPSSKGGGGAFSSIFAADSGGSRDHRNSTDGEDGVFLDRTMQERKIEEKLRPIGDEASIYEEIIDSRNKDIKEIRDGVIVVNQMFNEISVVVKAGEENIQQIHRNVENTLAETKAGMENINKAEKAQRQGNCVVS